MSHRCDAGAIVVKNFREHERPIGSCPDKADLPRDRFFFFAPFRPETGPILRRLRIGSCGALLRNGRVFARYRTRSKEECENQTGDELEKRLGFHQAHHNEAEYALSNLFSF
jgi:hypothetical protein